MKTIQSTSTKYIMATITSPSTAWQLQLYQIQQTTTTTPSTWDNYNYTKYSRQLQLDQVQQTNKLHQAQQTTTTTLSTAWFKNDTKHDINEQFFALNTKHMFLFICYSLYKIIYEFNIIRLIFTGPKTLSSLLIYQSTIYQSTIVLAVHKK